MKNIKLALVHVVALATLFFGAIEMAFGHTNDSANTSNSQDAHRNKSKAIPAATTAAAAAITPNPDCTLIVPNFPLTAAGLATPYQLVATDPANGPCNEANAAQSAFVQAAIIDTATGKISIYNPLVIDEGTVPAAATVVPTLPANAVVGIWFGYNGTNLTLQSARRGDDLQDSNCVNGVRDSVFTQYAYCNAPNFFRVANRAVRDGLLKVPALGNGTDGQLCPSVRSFFVVDQDQSDNLPTTYLATATGQTAQYTQTNLAALTGATPLGNPSDNRLTDVFLDGALGCTAWKQPDLADPGQTVPALPLNELQARYFQPTPVALVPAGDPMTEVNGNLDLLKVNLYRLGVDQPLADSYFDADTARYCRQMLRIAPARFLIDQALLTAGPTPDAGAANNLFTFMAQRFVASYQILNCQNLINQADPVTVTTDANGVAIGAAINTLTYSEQVQDIAASKAADDAADSAARALRPIE